MFLFKCLFQIESLKFGLKQLETSIYCEAHKIFRDTELFRRGSSVWKMDVQMDRQRDTQNYD